MAKLDLRYRSKHQLATEYIRSLITTGKVQPGERILTGRIATDLDMSHTPVREALKQIVSAGILAQIPHVGVVVPEMDEEEIREAFEMRAALSAIALRLNAPHYTGRSIKRLDHALRNCKDCLDRGDAVGYAEANLRFHELLTDTGHFKHLHRTLLDLRVRTERFRWGFRLIPGRMKASYEEHLAIRNALAQGDVDGAEARMREHETAAMVALMQCAEAKRSQGDVCGDGRREAAESAQEKQARAACMRRKSDA